jgi:hypothetical protein
MVSFQIFDILEKQRHRDSNMISDCQGFEGRWGEIVMVDGCNDAFFKIPRNVQHKKWIIKRIKYSYWPTS